jgi:GNAT superfamily N-acetyltransferase
MNINIRPCEQQDLEKLVELCSHHAQYEQSYYTEAGKSARLLDAIFGPAPKLFCRMIECGQSVIGYFSYTFDYSTWDARLFLHLDCLYLDPEFRGKGIGEKVFITLREIASDNNCSLMQWQTPAFNEGAIRFYKRMGATSKTKVRFFLEVEDQTTCYETAKVCDQ